MCQQKVTLCQQSLLYVNKGDCMSTKVTVCQQRLLYVKNGYCMSTKFTVCQQRLLYVNKGDCMSTKVTVCQQRWLYVNKTWLYGIKASVGFSQCVTFKLSWWTFSIFHMYCSLAHFLVSIAGHISGGKHSILFIRNPFKRNKL